MGILEYRPGVSTFCHISGLLAREAGLKYGGDIHLGDRTLSLRVRGGC